MEKIIEIDLFEQDDLLEKYNRKKVSNNLINYILESTLDFNKNGDIKIVINNHLKETNVPIDLINEGLKNEYKESLKKHFRTNVVQTIYLLLGMLSYFFQH